ncbi:MAG: helix-turn-helix domain-containing protein [Kiritimatiellales bacterium]|nr:helix-turn-helix domain-containing protein [Kiritimatiellales bacterium]
MQTTTKIPDAIKTAAAAMLAPYCNGGLTPEKLETAISFKPDEEVAEKLLTRKEAAAALSVSLPTLDRMLRENELPRRRIRGAVRIPKSAINAFVLGKEVAA